MQELILSEKEEDCGLHRYLQVLQEHLEVLQLEVTHLDDLLPTDNRPRPVVRHALEVPAVPFEAREEQFEVRPLHVDDDVAVNIPELHRAHVWSREDWLSKSRFGGQTLLDRCWAIERYRFGLDFPGFNRGGWHRCRCSTHLLRRRELGSDHRSFFDHLRFYGGGSSRCGSFGIGMRDRC